MAPWQRRHTGAVLLLSLFLLSIVSHAGKEAAARSRSHAELQDDQEQHQLDEEAMSLTAVAERCGGGGGAGAGAEGEGEEECLMRRTLVAHTDYIYTQGGGHN